jgi:hypothetical protein
MQTVWLIESLVEERQDDIRRQVAEARRRAPRPPVPAGPRPSWRVRLGWRLVEVGLRLALPGAERPGRTAGTQGLATWPMP